MSHPNFLTVTAPHERALIQVLIMAIDFDGSGRLDPDHPQSMPRLVESLAYRYSGKRSRSLRQVAGLLAEGVSMVDSLEQTPRALDPSAVMAIRLASETGMIRETLASLVDTDHDEGSPAEVSGFRFSPGEDGKFFQLTIGFCATWFIVSFLAIFILPTIEMMFREFEIELPASTLVFIQVSKYGAFLFWSFLFFFVVLFLVERRLRGRAIWKRGTHRSIANESAHLLALLAMVIRQGRPLASGITTLANYHPTPQIGSRLSSASVAIGQGSDAWQSLQHQGFLSPNEAEGFASVEGSDPSVLPDHARQSQAWLLEYLASQRRDHVRNRSGWWIQSISFVLLMLLSAIVLFTSFAVFSSVYRLVTVLSETMS